MKRRRCLWLCLLLLLVALLLVPGVHWRLIGWVKGEAFYQGRPTSWWRDECQSWKCMPPFRVGDWARDRSHGWLSFANDYLPAPKMPLLSGDPAAVPVLLELLAIDDVSCELVAIKAVHILGSEAKRALPTLLGIIRRRRSIEGHIC